MLQALPYSMSVSNSDLILTVNDVYLKSVLLSVHGKVLLMAVVVNSLLHTVVMAGDNGILPPVEPPVELKSN